MNFASLDKAEQKHQLIMDWGRLIAPLDDLVCMVKPPTVPHYHLAFARIETDLRSFHDRIYQFATFGDVVITTVALQLESVARPDSGYSPLFPISQRINPLNLGPGSAPPDLDDLYLTFEAALADIKARFYTYINMIPVEWEATLYQAKTPFTVYLRIMDAVATAQRRIDYFDRYLKEDFYQLYLRHLDRSIAVRLITTHGTATKDYGVEAVLTVSDRCRREFADYRLVEVSYKEIHGRMLRIDDQIFNLDSGASDAGKYPTLFSPMPSQPPDHRILDDVLHAGKTVHQS